MNRRDFVTRLSGTLAAGGTVAATAAVASRDRALEGAQALQNEIKALNKRLDDVDDGHKRLFKGLIFVASVSTGLDVLNLLKGDLLS